MYVVCIYIEKFFIIFFCVSECGVGYHIPSEPPLSFVADGVPHNLFLN